MDVLLIAVIGTLNIVCFFVGAKVGQMASKEKDIELPKIDPIAKYKEYQEGKEAEREREKVETIMRNIERYDGTDFGQEDVPR